MFIISFLIGFSVTLICSFVIAICLLLYKKYKEIIETVIISIVGIAILIIVASGLSALGEVIIAIYKGVRI